MKPINVLVTAASRRVALVRNFRLALQPLGGHVVAVDYDTNSPALFFANKHYKVPLVMDPTYLATLENIVEKEAITLIIPTIDQELQLWAEKKAYFAGKGVHVSISPAPTIQVCNDKWLTYQFFKEHGFPFPQTYLKEHLSYQMKYPLFIKPRAGRGSVQSYIVQDKRELDFFVEYVHDPLVQDFLPGKEFTVDAYFSLSGELISYVPRWRMVIRSGVSDRGRTFSQAGMCEWIQAIGKALPFEGAINIQGKINKDEIMFFEINPRFSGGIQLSLAAGPNYADYLIEELSGGELEPQLGDYDDHLTMASYEDSLFLDSRRNVAFFYCDNTGIFCDHQGILPRKNKKKL